MRITPKSIKLLVKSGVRVGKNHLPTLLTITAVSGLIATGVMASRAGVEAKDILEKKRRDDPDATKLEMVASVFPYYAPAIAVGGLTIVCIIGSNNLNLRKQAAIASACTLAEDALKEYQDKIKEKLADDEKMRNAITESIMDDKANASTTDICVLPGQVLCMESYTRRCFSSTPEAVKVAEAKLNSLFVDQGYASLNDFYTFLGIERTPAGDILGWNSSDQHNDRYWITGTDVIETEHHSTLTDGDVMCYVIRFVTDPKSTYLRY
jgi:hypothetical protein